MTNMNKNLTTVNRIEKYMNAIVNAIINAI